MSANDRYLEYVDGHDCVEVVDPFIVDVDAIREGEVWRRHPKKKQVRVAKPGSPETQGHRLQ